MNSSGLAKNLKGKKKPKQLQPPTYAAALGKLDLTTEGKSKGKLQSKARPKPKKGKPSTVNWACSACTFLNPLSNMHCSLCESERPGKFAPASTGSNYKKGKKAKTSSLNVNSVRQSKQKQSKQKKDSDEKLVLAKRVVTTPGKFNPDRYVDGMMFVCTKETYKECMELSLLGLPHEYMSQVKTLKKEKSALFLFNMTDRRLHGIFEASSSGSENIDPHAWARNKRYSWSSPFPAQIEFKLAQSCEPLNDADFRHMFNDRQRIRKLGKHEVGKLIRIFLRGPGDRERERDRQKAAASQSAKKKVEKAVVAAAKVVPPSVAIKVLSNKPAFAWSSKAPKLTWAKPTSQDTADDASDNTNVGPVNSGVCKAKTSQTAKVSKSGSTGKIARPADLVPPGKTQTVNIAEPAAASGPFASGVNSNPKSNRGNNVKTNSDSVGGNAVGKGLGSSPTVKHTPKIQVQSKPSFSDQAAASYPVGGEAQSTQTLPTSFARMALQGNHEDVDNRKSRGHGNHAQGTNHLANGAREHGTSQQTTRQATKQTFGHNDNVSFPAANHGPSGVWRRGGVAVRWQAQPQHSPSSSPSSSPNMSPQMPPLVTGNHMPSMSVPVPVMSSVWAAPPYVPGYSDEYDGMQQQQNNGQQVPHYAPRVGNFMPQQYQGQIHSHAPESTNTHYNAPTQQAHSGYARHYYGSNDAGPSYDYNGCTANGNGTTGAFAGSNPSPATGYDYNPSRANENNNESHVSTPDVSTTQQGPYKSLSASLASVDGGKERSTSISMPALPGLSNYPGFDYGVATFAPTSGERAEGVFRNFGGTFGSSSSKGLGLLYGGAFPSTNTMDHMDPNGQSRDTSRDGWSEYLNGLGSLADTASLSRPPPRTAAVTPTVVDSTWGQRPHAFASSPYEQSGDAGAYAHATEQDSSLDYKSAFGHNAPGHSWVGA